MSPISIVKKHCSLCVIFLPLVHCYIFVVIYGGSWGILEIVFEKKNSPPAIIPKDANKIYSVSLNQRISKPIIAHLENDGVKITTGEIANLPFTVETVDESVYRSNSAVDEWKESGGRLCMFAFDEKYPNRLLKQYARRYCGENGSYTIVNTDLKAFDGVLTADFLSHQHADFIVPENKRVFVFSVTLPNSTVVSKATNPVLVENPAWGLKFENVIASIHANNPFDIVLKILDRNKKQLTKGLDSTAIVEVRVSWEYAKHNLLFDNGLMMANTMAALDSTEIMEHGYYRDKMLRKRAVGGEVSFKNVRILDVISKLRLNATLIQPRPPWLRTPDIYNDVLTECKKKEDGFCTFKIKFPLSPAVVLSNFFEVKVQNASKLHMLLPNKQNQLKDIAANLPLVPGIIFEIKDENGYRIYTGYDSSLVVSSLTNPPNVCISDRFLQMHEGRYEFGNTSICETADTLQLYFSVKTSTGEILKTEKTNTFKVTGDIYIAHFDFLFTDGTGLNTGPTENAFISIAVDYFNKQLRRHNRKLHLVSVENHQDREKFRKGVTKLIKNGKDFPNKKIWAVIGAGGPLFRGEVSQILTDEYIPFVATKDEKEIVDTEFNVRAICWNQAQLLEAMMKAFTARKWTQIIVLTDEDFDHGEYIQKAASKEGIDVVLKIVMKVPDWYYVGMMTKEMQEITAFKVKIIVFAANKTIIPYIIREAYHHKISCQHGYQWVTYGDTVRDFPWGNKEPECRHEPPCTRVFKGMLGFVPAYNLSGVNNDQWIRVMTAHITADPSITLGKTRFSTNQGVGIFGLAYDATILVCTGIFSAIKAKISGLGRNILDFMSEARLDGLTGYIKTDTVKRANFRGIIITVNPLSDDLYLPVRQVKIDWKYLKMMGDEEDQYLLEIDLQANHSINKHPWHFEIAPHATPNTKHLNKCL